MAAVTVNSSVRSVFGNKRAVLASVQVATTGDTWATGLSTIDVVLADPSSAIASGITKSGGTVTFLQAADTAVQVMAIGI